MKLIAYAAAWPIEGGGYRGAAKDKLTGRIIRGRIRENLEAARNDAKRLAGEIIAGRPYAPGLYRRNGEWACNYYGS